MSVATPEEDVKAYLDSLSIGAQVFCGPVRPSQPPAIPVKAVFVLATGGSAPSPYMDGLNTSTGSYRMMRVQVRVRGEPNDYKTPRDLAATIWSALQTPPSTMTGSYTRVTCDQSVPLFLGRNDMNQYEFTVNTTLEKRSQ